MQQNQIPFVKMFENCNNSKNYPGSNRTHVSVSVFPPALSCSSNRIFVTQSKFVNQKSEMPQHLKLYLIKLLFFE